MWRAGKRAQHRRVEHVRVAVREGAAHGERHGWTKFTSMQNHYNLIYRGEEREMIPQCIEMGVGVIPWSPLARGFLAGNRRGAIGARRSGRRMIPSPTACLCGRGFSGG